LFYFKALQIGDVSKVASIDKLGVAITIFLAVLLLNEPAGFKTIMGGILITCGAFILILQDAFAVDCAENLNLAV
jgi:transporter family protein